MKLRIEKWSIINRHNSPHTPPEMRVAVLRGLVYGHPKFQDGQSVITTAIVGTKNGCILTGSGMEYELGEPHPDYEAAYPNAKARALATTSNT